MHSDGEQYYCTCFILFYASTRTDRRAEEMLAVSICPFEPPFVRLLDLANTSAYSEN